MRFIPTCPKPLLSIAYPCMYQGQKAPRQGRPDAGFTLLEIMIVVGIIGIILAVAVPSWLKTRERAQRDICIENLLQIETAKQLWALETGAGTGAEPGDEDLVGPTLYLKVFPLCPGGGEYDIMPIGEPAECTIEEHELEG
jgi:prepilin-type N-terminal cleavage/methylation domain-containing protein